MKDERQKLVNHMEYMEGMEQIDSDIMEKVINARDNYQAEAYTAQDVRRAMINVP